MMPYIVILEVREFHQPTGNSFGTARQKPVGGGGGEGQIVHCILPTSLNRDNPISTGGVFHPPICFCL